jgi:hypothetical protein
MERINNFKDFLNEAESTDEVKLKVDNKSMEKVKAFFKKHTDLFKPHNTHGASPASNVNQKEQTRKMEEAGISTKWPFGYCYPCSQFVFYALGGYSSDWDLKLIKKIDIKVKDKKVGQTTHWFVQHKTDGTIIDLTKEQFTGVLDIDSLYPTARRANLGFPHYNVDGKKKEYGHTVPCLQVLKLYDTYREEVEKVPGLEKYWSGAKYATTRRKANEQYDNSELATIPLNEQYCFL